MLKTFLSPRICGGGRINEHLKYKNNSNVALQKAFVKYGLDKFKLYIYEYFTYESKIISHKSLTELETSYISKFDFEILYNFSTIAHNNLGYKHTDESKLKIRSANAPRKFKPYVWKNT